MTKDYGKVLGELETKVMETVSEKGMPVSVSDVVKVLSKKRLIAYTTVMTIIANLTEKVLLRRRTVGKAYAYQPTYSKDTFLTRVSRQIIKNLVSSFGDTAIAHFAEEIENVKPYKRRQLKKLLKLN